MSRVGPEGVTKMLRLLSLSAGRQALQPSTGACVAPALGHARELCSASAAHSLPAHGAPKAPTTPEHSHSSGVTCTAPDSQWRTASFRSIGSQTVPAAALAGGRSRRGSLPGGLGGFDALSSQGSAQGPSSRGFASGGGANEQQQQQSSGGDQQRGQRFATEEHRPQDFDEDLDDEAAAAAAAFSREWPTVELGSTTGIRVLNVAGVGQSGWDIIEDSINEDNRSMVWTLDTTEGKVPENEQNALLSEDAKEEIARMYSLDPVTCSIPFLASLFGIRQQRVLAIIAIKEMEASAEPMIDPNAVVAEPSEAEIPDLDAEAGGETEEGLKLSGEGADEVSQDSDSSDSDDSEVEAKANMSIEECDSLPTVRADPTPTVVIQDAHIVSLCSYESQIRSCDLSTNLPPQGSAELHHQSVARWLQPSRSQPSQHRRRIQPTAALRIDRAGHLERAWQRQAAEEATLAEEEAANVAGRHVLEVRNLPHFDRLLDDAGSGVVAVAFYSRSCGSSRTVLQRYSEQCKEGAAARSGLRFLKHNIRNEFDDPSDVARMFRVRAAPCVYFFVGGANVQQLQLRDMRSLSGSSDHIQRLISADHQRLSSALREIVFRIAPSARR